MTSSNNQNVVNSQQRRPARRKFDRVNTAASGEERNNESDTSGTTSDQIIVTILDSAQNKFQINLASDSTVLELKERGQEVHSIAPEKQRLICMGQLLRDENLITDHNITDGSIVHLFPKPTVVIQESSDANGTQENQTNSTTENNNGVQSPGAHVPQIVMDSNEFDMQSSILILSTHEAYETMHRIRLLSFLLLMYSTMTLLRDFSIWAAPPIDPSDSSVVIPPGDPTDTRLPGMSNSNGSDYDEELPQWQDRYYLEAGICTLGTYVALLGIKSTSEQISLALTRRFVVLLFILGVSWSSYLFWCDFDILKSRETKADYESGKVFSDALFAIALPFFLWVMFFVRGIQYYMLVKEAEDDARRRSRTLADAADQISDANREEGHDLELQMSDRSIV